MQAFPAAPRPIVSAAFDAEDTEVRARRAVAGWHQWLHPVCLCGPSLSLLRTRMTVVFGPLKHGPSVYVYRTGRRRGAAGNVIKCSDGLERLEWAASATPASPGPRQDTRGAEACSTSRCEW